MNAQAIVHGGYGHEAAAPAGVEPRAPRVIMPQPRQASAVIAPPVEEPPAAPEEPAPAEEAHPPAASSARLVDLGVDRRRQALAPEAGQEVGRGHRREPRSRQGVPAVSGGHLPRGTARDVSPVLQRHLLRLGPASELGPASSDQRVRRKRDDSRDKKDKRRKQ